LGNENVFDQSVLRIAPAMRDMHVAPYDDGHIRHACIGTFRANPFGLYDMIGNVSEWSADVDVKDLITLQPGEKVASSRRETRFALGGSFSIPPDQCVPSERFTWTAQTQNPTIGLRAARALRP
jgi:formylglycine-generating enzyme required for sulfatase activity